MSMDKRKCLYCDRTSDDVAIIVFQYLENEYGICPQHLPILIHKPTQLAEKLPGAETFGASEGHSH